MFRLLLLFVALAGGTLAFLIDSTGRATTSSRQLVWAAAATVSIEKPVERDMDALLSWATQQGVLQENGLQLWNRNMSGDDDDDWSVTLSQAGTQASRVLQVPPNLILSSTRIRQELEVPPAALELIETKKCQDQIPQFYLWLKVLQEYEKAQDSPWYQWMQSLPRKFDTAVCMDDVELECLPPFAWSLAKLERTHLHAFSEALEMVDNVTQETKQDTELTRWAFNVVFTRCWGQDGDDDNRCDLVPMGDMFNHGDPANVCIHYDEEANCNVLLKHDIEAGSPLRLSYGKSTNPSRFLSIFGFVDETQPVIFCQILASKPTKRHVDIGYDTAKMVFSTKDGTIANAVWDVILFSILEQVPEVQEAFYQAHVKGDHVTKDAIHHQFCLETCIVLKKHVDNTRRELETLLRNIDELDSLEHSRLPMIRKHNAFVHQTFSKVKVRLDQLAKAEFKKRKA
jgi:hypothetical protein